MEFGSVTLKINNQHTAEHAHHWHEWREYEGMCRATRAETHTGGAET